MTFSYKKRNDNNKSAVSTIDIVEFIKRFLTHVLPNGFTRIRYYGIFSCRTKQRSLEICREIFKQNVSDKIDITVPDGVYRCPVCGKGLMVIYRKISQASQGPPVLNAA